MLKCYLDSYQFSYMYIYAYKCVYIYTEALIHTISMLTYMFKYTSVYAHMN